MPHYSYECQNTKCAHTFEEMQLMTAPSLKKCPACKKKSLVRLIGAGTGILFKGSWPGQDIKRKAEDSSLFSKAKVARRLKNSGELPKDAVVHAKDVDLSKYNGPKKLPKDHPENWKPAKKKGSSNT